MNNFYYAVLAITFIPAILCVFGIFYSVQRERLFNESIRLSNERKKQMLAKRQTVKILLKKEQK